jgi:bacillithiol system protein YtxJ
MLARMRRQLTDEREAEAIIAAERPGWIYKHSATCGISGAALEQVDSYLAAHPADELGMVVVQSHRPLSNQLASRLKYAHQSPQLFLVRGGAVLWQASHWGISAEAMAEARARAEAPTRQG